MRYAAIVPPIATASLLMLAACDPDKVTDARPTDLRVVRSSNFSDWSTPISLGPLINTPQIEAQPTLTKDGLTLYFSSGRPTDPADTDFDQNIWVAQRGCTDAADPACAWQQPVPLGPQINGPYFDVTPALSRDEHQLFYASQRSRENCAVEPCDRDIWVSYREDKNDPLGWQTPINLGAGVNGSGEDLAPSYFENEGGQPQLFFTRGLLGVAELYISHMQTDGSWGPASAITELNSPVADARPSVTHDGLEIYFWSTRPPGPSFQIWHAARAAVTDSWSAPTQVPSPISDAPSQQPFIYQHGNSETLLFNRTTPAGGQDLFMSQRIRGGR